MRRTFREEVNELQPQMFGFRTAQGGDVSAVDPAAAHAVSNAAGLALSGGGIRSVTFCLGIVQALQDFGLFTQFDYLSTVSGGGYLGAFISSYLGADPPKLDEVEQRIAQRRNQPLDNAPQAMRVLPDDAHRAALGSTARARVAEAFRRPDSGSSESSAIRHLRNNSRYLLNGGGWGLLRIGGVFVTGFFTSLLMLLTLPLTTAWAVRGIKEATVSEFFVAHLLWLLEPWRVRGSAAFTALAVLAAIPYALRRGKGGPAAKLIMGVGAVSALVWMVAAIRARGLWTVYYAGPAGPLQMWQHPAGISLAGVLALLIIWALALTLVAAGNVALCAAYPVVRGYEVLGGQLGGMLCRLVH